MGPVKESSPLHVLRKSSSVPCHDRRSRRRHPGSHGPISAEIRHWVDAYALQSKRWSTLSLRPAWLANIRDARWRVLPRALHGTESLYAVGSARTKERDPDHLLRAVGRSFCYQRPELQRGRMEL